MRGLSVLALALVSTVAGAQAKKAPIADNSFLMEEAYNQEPGVIQHISLLQKASKGSSWIYAFTQEWPVGGQKHQFSYTVPFASLGKSASGLGDLMLNWRYQLVGKDDDATWISPRVSLSLPTGDEDKFLGSGGMGWQFDIPISHRWSDEMVSHTNIGMTLQPDASAGSVNYSTTDLNLGQSFIWQPADRFNLMLETIWTSRSTKLGNVTNNTSFGYFSPGARWGFDFTSGLQVVPGIAFPIGFGDAQDDNSILLYISFEHPLKKK
jgi:hypothetical protein